MEAATITAKTPIARSTFAHFTLYIPTSFTFRSFFSASEPLSSTNAVETAAGAISPAAISSAPVFPGTKAAGIQKIQVNRYVSTKNSTGRYRYPFVPLGFVMVLSSVFFFIDRLSVGISGK